MQYVDLYLILLLFGCICFNSSLSLELEWLSEFAVELDGDETVAQLVAGSHGFHVISHGVTAPQLDTHRLYHFHHPYSCPHSRCRRQTQELVKKLLMSPHVRRVEQQFVLRRDKRGYRDEEEQLARRILEMRKRKQDDDEYVEMVRRLPVKKFNDPSFTRQWHLMNRLSDNPGLDMNVQPVWKKGFDGTGVAVTVVDDGVDSQHPDLKNRIDPLASADFNDLNDPVGDPRSSDTIVKPSEGHGTQCAGEIGAEANNKFCGVGVAYNSSLGGIRILAGKVTDLMEAFGLLHNNQYISIYSCSWGPKDNGFTMEMPHYYTSKALVRGVNKGRAGRGSIFVYAAGNGAHTGDNCGADGYVNSPYTIAFSSVNIHGKSAHYDESCAAVMAANPVGGGIPKDRPQITTTGANSKCVNNFSGTSASAPLGSACIALALQANPSLTWRDVQHLITRSTRLPSGSSRGWQMNAAGHHVSHKFGFGLLNCAGLVARAQTWKTVGTRHNCTGVLKGSASQTIVSGGQLVKTFTSDGCVNDPSRRVDKLEHVLLGVNLTHEHRGRICIWLKAPSGTLARMLGTRVLDKSHEGMKQVFLSVLHWNESPRGEWKVEIRDENKDRKQKNRVSGRLLGLSLQFFGTASDGSDGRKQKKREMNVMKKRWMSSQQVYDLFNEQRRRALVEEPEHRDVVQMKRKLSKFTNGDELDKNIVNEARNLRYNKYVTTDELRSVLEKLEEVIIEKKKSKRKYS